jgi:hypothetical protein
MRQKELVSVQLQTETQADEPEPPVDEPGPPDEPELPGDEPGPPANEPYRCDEDNTPSKARWREDFPHQAGRGLRREPTVFESLRDAQVARGESIWGMFLDEGDWEIAQWILKSGTTHASTNELLELKKVSKRFINEYRTYHSIADSKC